MSLKSYIQKLVQNKKIKIVIELSSIKNYSRGRFKSLVYTSTYIICQMPGEKINNTKQNVLHYKKNYGI